VAKSQYDKYFITEIKKPGLKFPSDERSVFLWSDDEVVKGAFYMECVWFWSKETRPPVGETPHVHTWDEILGFFGSNPEDPYDLCGEVEVWLEEVKHVMTKSFLVFIPAGMRHRTVRINRVDRPIFHIATGPSTTYTKVHDK
jgi:hypothetical protein